MFWVAVFGLLAVLLLYLLHVIRVQQQSRFTALAAALFCVLLCFSASEVALRVYQRVRRGVGFFVSNNDFSDPELGWTGRASFGAEDSTKKHVLIVGDSFTDGMEVAEEDLYSSVLGRELNVEPFAYGGRGYGTLQELMVVERYLDQVQPSLILLQVCSNDLLNNSWELERRSFRQNMGMVRPYLEAEEIVYRYPRSMPAVRQVLAANSRVFHLVFVRWETLLIAVSGLGWVHGVEDDLAAGRLSSELNGSIAATRELLARMKRRAGAIPLKAFMADAPEPYLGHLRAIFAEQQVPLITSIAGAIEKEKQAGRSPVLPDGVHWNEHGHDVVGRALARELRQPPESVK